MRVIGVFFVDLARRPRTDDTLDGTILMSEKFRFRDRPVPFVRNIQNIGSPDERLVVIALRGSNARQVLNQDVCKAVDDSVLSARLRRISGPHA